MPFNLHGPSFVCSSMSRRPVSPTADLSVEEPVLGVDSVDDSPLWYASSTSVDSDDTRGRLPEIGLPAVDVDCGSVPPTVDPPSTLDSLLPDDFLFDFLDVDLFPVTPHPRELQKFVRLASSSSKSEFRRTAER